MTKTTLCCFILSALLTSVPALGTSEPEADSAPDSACVACHAELADDAAEYVRAWKRDVHHEVGLGCESCHGGNPSMEVAEDPEASMDPAHGYEEAPGRLELADFCARCHSDADYMKQFNPQARVDQLLEYRTSVHGKANAGGDPKPATCTDCHGVHGIERVGSPHSPVYASNVPQTCAVCHSDAGLMGPYGIPTDQHELYLGSMHAAALLDREDTAAPACNDCHGNHGAAPPGVQSVANVCGQCHGREAQLFRASHKKEIFDALDVGECAVCHDNHLIVHPTPEMLRNDSAPVLSTGRVAGLRPFRAELGSLEPGGTATLRWTLVLSTGLEADDERLSHGVAVLVAGNEHLALDASVRLDEMLDSEPRTAAAGGLSAALTIEGLSGLPVRAGDALRYRLELTVEGENALDSVSVIHATGRGLDMAPGSICMTCHEEGDACDEATAKMYEALTATDRELREAAGLLHDAEVAGMDVADVLFELSSGGTNAALQARALLHSFDPERVIEGTGEARGIAAKALAAGRAALDELQYRRKGLAVSLVLIALVLVALYLKIRDVDRRRSVSKG